MAGLFNKLFSKAKAEKATVGKATITVNMVDSDGEKVKITAKPSTLPESSGVQFYGEALASVEEAKMSQKDVFDKSSGSKSIGVSGKFASREYLDHENAA